MFESINTLSYYLDLCGVAVFAISSALTAGRKGLDLFGVIVISIVTAIGGGTLRDLLLDRHPIFWINDPAYLAVIIVSALFTLIYVRKNAPPFKALLIADALGLSLFTIAGTQIAETFDLNWMIMIIMGTITGVAGGMIRDILSAEIPLILRRDIYATAALSGSAFYLVLKEAGAGKEIAVILGVLTVVILRMLAIVWNLRLPVFKLQQDNE